MIYSELYNLLGPAWWSLPHFCLLVHFRIVVQSLQQNYWVNYPIRSVDKMTIDWLLLNLKLVSSILFSFFVLVLFFFFFGVGGWVGGGEGCRRVVPACMAWMLYILWQELRNSMPVSIEALRSVMVCHWLINNEIAIRAFFWWHFTLIWF